METFWAVAVLIWLLCTIIEACQPDVVLSPRDIYDRTVVNWFGAYFLFILLCLVSPLIAVFKFLNWIFTVGRKN